MTTAILPSVARRAPRLPLWMVAILLAAGGAALMVPWLIVKRAPQLPPAARQVVRPQRVVPKAELPPVEPIAFQDLAPQDARAYNASIPFSDAPNPPARPFNIYGSDESVARATDCLAAAVLYEAGDDAVGERAVAQVVLNRVRHPAFPKTVCGVVFQGAERRTGCQFTFTCDGAMLRAVSPAAWTRARAIALAALTGRVDRAVGHATHYHTDWVVPYWSASLDKIVEVHTHLFFRWSGWWGTPPAFRSTYVADEPAVPQMARLSDAHRTPETEAALAALESGVTPPAVLSTVTDPEAAARDSNTFLVTLNPAHGAEMLPFDAQNTCGVRGYCKYMAWSSKAATPAALPITPVQQRAMSFSYLRDRASGFEKSLWNCAEFKRADPNQCMKAQVLAPAPDPANALRGVATAGAPAPTAKPPEPLVGVRRKPDAPVVAPPTLVPTTPKADPPND